MMVSGMKEISKFFIFTLVALLFIPSCSTQKANKTESLRKVSTLVWNFETFSGKADAHIQSLQVNQDFNIYLKMKSDSIIWVSFTGFLNIEGFRALITPDTLRILDRLSNTAYEANFQSLVKKYSIPLRFNEFQKLLISSAFYKTNQSKMLTSSSEIVVEEKKCTFYINPKNYTMTEFRLKDDAGIQTLKANFGQHTVVKGHNFATEYKILTGFNHEEISLNYNFKSYAFDEGIETPYQVPASFSVKSFR